MVVVMGLETNLTPQHIHTAHLLIDREYQLSAIISSQALNLAEEKGSTMEFLRQGYTKGTWWEVNTEEEKSSVWRS